MDGDALIHSSHGLPRVPGTAGDSGLIFDTIRNCKINDIDGSKVHAAAHPVQIHQGVRDSSPADADGLFRRGLSLLSSPLCTMKRLSAGYRLSIRVFFGSSVIPLRIISSIGIRRKTIKSS